MNENARCKLVAFRRLLLDMKHEMEQSDFNEVQGVVQLTSTVNQLDFIVREVLDRNNK